MFYFGLRSSHLYLASLEDVRSGGDRVSLTSVIGGFAFLHALRPGVSAITLVDCDPDALLHWRLMARLIECAESLEDFVYLLSGGHMPAAPVTSAPIVFAPKRDPHPRLSRVLSPELHALYKCTYGAMVIDNASGHGHIGPSLVMFTGFDLAPNRFCWHFGSRNFRDNSAFRSLQQILQAVPIDLVCGALETLDYARLAAGEARHVFLASNCESPLFTQQDVIFAQVARTTACPVRYVSWLRDGWIDPRDTAPRRGAIDVASLPFDQARLLTLPGLDMPDRLARRLQNVVPFEGLDDPRLRQDYGHTTLLVLAGGDRSSTMQLLAEIAPTFGRVLWVSGLDVGPAVPDEVCARYAHAVTDVPGTEYFELRALRSGLLSGAPCASC